jgi:hypothetical protein
MENVAIQNSNRTYASGISPVGTPSWGATFKIYNNFLIINPVPSLKIL